MLEEKCKKISIVMPTFNKLSRLKLTLASIDRQNLAYDKFEVIIINDGSTDKTKKYLEQRKCKWNLKVINQQNQGRAVARNIGVQAAMGDYILFSDDDCIMCPDFIETHYSRQIKCPVVLHGRIITLTQMKFFDDPSKGTLIFAGDSVKKSRLQGNILTEEDIINEFQTKVASNNRLNTMEKSIKEIFERKLHHLYWIGFTGGNVSIPFKWLESVGMFDDNFGSEWGCEDLELGYRLAHCGYPFNDCNEATNYHIAHAHMNFEQEVEQSFTKFEKLHQDKYIKCLKEYLLGSMNIEQMLNI